MKIVRCKLKSKNFKAFASAAIVFLSGHPLFACGPCFPNNLLDSGDNAVLVAPIADFQRELQRIHFPPSPFHAISTTNDFAEQSADAELDDLQSALERSGRPPSAIKTVVKKHRLERSRLQNYVESLEHWKLSAPMEWDAATTNYVRKPAGPAPEFPEMDIPGGLPEEFSDYFAGAIVWENPAVTNKEVAWADWERVLALPPQQRRFKSTWAAFMLGKSWSRENPDKAIGYFRRVRDLSQHGFVDSCGLAAASLGLEAQIELRRKNFPAAIELYLRQMTTGDKTAYESLRFASAKVFADADASGLKKLAANPQTRRVLTAYLISMQPGDNRNAFAGKWLAAVEAANIKDVDSAEELALAAYQSGQWDRAQRWINRSTSAPVSQWLQAKLLLRDGKMDEAAKMLAKVVRQFPLNSDTNALKFRNNLSVPADCDMIGTVSAPNQVLGELGVLRLARREYVESLDALLRAGFWMDAAYVAERVLTVDELKRYVDRNWPEATNKSLAGPRYYDGISFRGKIRYLLARRLARLNRMDEARAYFPPDERPQLDALAHELQIGRDESLPPAQRSEALLSAAWMTRTNGMELLGTEVEPDWFIYDGGFEEGVSLQTRTNGSVSWLSAGADEIRRAEQNNVVPEERFHYRFQAAVLAVDAAKLLPDNSNETARVLCTAGSWIKYLDPPKADPIYKTLVRRCSQTAIGRQADAMRWFPVLDAAGNPTPYRPRTNDAPRPVVFGNPDDYGDAFQREPPHMMDRQNGWAQTATSIYTNNDWMFNDNAILRTTDGGRTWKRVLCADKDVNMFVYFYDADTAWVASTFDDDTNITILKTMDGGQTWNRFQFSQSSPYVTECYLSFVSMDKGWLMVIPDHGMNSSPGYLYQTDNGGETWQPVNSAEGNPFIWEDAERADSEFTNPHPYLVCGGSMMFQNENDGWVYGSLASTTPSYLFATVDAGHTWQVKQFPLPPSLRDGRIEPWGLPQFFGRDGIVVALFVPSDSKSTNFYTVVYDSNDGGKMWRPTTPVKFSGVWSFISAQKGWMWSPEPHGSNSTRPTKGTLYCTEDGGNTWTVVEPRRSLESFLVHGENITRLDFVDEKCGRAIAENYRRQTQLLETTDGGITWEPLPVRQK